MSLISLTGSAQVNEGDGALVPCGEFQCSLVKQVQRWIKRACRNWPMNSGCGFHTNHRFDEKAQDHESRRNTLCICTSCSSTGVPCPPRSAPAALHSPHITALILHLFVLAAVSRNHCRAAAGQNSLDWSCPNTCTDGVAPARPVLLTLCGFCIGAAVSGSTPGSFFLKFFHSI